MPIVRPKSLGLGADKSILLQTSNSKHKHHSKSTQEDELVLKCGSYCMLLGGKHDGLYATVRLFIVIHRTFIHLSVVNSWLQMFKNCSLAECGDSLCGLWTFEV